MATNKIEPYNQTLILDIKNLQAEKLSLTQIAYTLNLNYLELKQYLTDLAADENAAGGSVTAIQIQMKRDDAIAFEKTKHNTWDLNNKL